MRDRVRHLRYRMAHRSDRFTLSISVLLSIVFAILDTLGAAAASQLSVGDSLPPGASLVSPNRAYELYNNETGFLVVRPTAAAARHCWRWAQPLSFSYKLLFVPSNKYTYSTAANGYFADAG